MNYGCPIAAYQYGSPRAYLRSAFYLENSAEEGAGVYFKLMFCGNSFGESNFGALEERL